MKKRNRLSDNEEMLIEYFWISAKPLTSIEIAQGFEPQGWSEATVYREINSLLDKNLLYVCGVELHKSQYARQFAPVLKKEAYIVKYLSSLGLNRNSLVEILMTLIAEESNNDELIMQMESIVRELREEKK